MRTCLRSSRISSPTRAGRCRRSAAQPRAFLEPAWSYRIDDRANWKTLRKHSSRVGSYHSCTRRLARAVGTAGKQYRHASLERFGAHDLVSSPAPESFEPLPAGRISGSFDTGTMDAFAKRPTTQAGVRGPR